MKETQNLKGSRNEEGEMILGEVTRKSKKKKNREKKPHRETEGKLRQ